MPEPYDDGSESDEKPHDASVQLRLAQKREKEMAAQLEELKAQQTVSSAALREAAFFRAGINPDDPRAKYFVKGYEGELTAEAIKAEASAAGLLSPQVDQSARQEAADLQRMGRASTGSTIPEPVSEGEAALAAELDSKMFDVWIPDGTMMDAMDILESMGGQDINTTAQRFRAHGEGWRFENPGA